MEWYGGNHRCVLISAAAARPFNSQWSFQADIRGDEGIFLLYDETIFLMTNGFASWQIVSSLSSSGRARVLVILVPSWHFGFILPSQARFIAPIPLFNTGYTDNQEPPSKGFLRVNHCSEVYRLHNCLIWLFTPQIRLRLACWKRYWIWQMLTSVHSSWVSLYMWL